MPNANRKTANKKNEINYDKNEEKKFQSKKLLDESIDDGLVKKLVNQYERKRNMKNKQEKLAITLASCPSSENSLNYRKIHHANLLMDKSEEETTRATKKKFFSSKENRQKPSKRTPNPLTGDRTSLTDRTTINEDNEQIFQKRVPKSPKKVDKMINDLYGLFRCLSEKDEQVERILKNRVSEIKSDDSGDNKFEENLKKKSEDDSCEYDSNSTDHTDETPSINYDEEYKEFFQNVCSIIRLQTGISVEGSNLNKEKFKQLIDLYGSSEKMADNVRIMFEPKVVVLQNHSQLFPTATQDDSANDEATSMMTNLEDEIGSGSGGEQQPKHLKLFSEDTFVAVTSQEIFIYPNELTLV